MIDLVLIDDDILIHGTWKMVARGKNQNLVCFSTAKAFLKESIEKSTPIYIDYHFNSGDNGFDVAKQLFQAGYKNLYIATGSVRGIPEKPVEIIAIVGKDYPL